MATLPAMSNGYEKNRHMQSRTTSIMAIDIGCESSALHLSMAIFFIPVGHGVRGAHGPECF